jgi:hypothetical protein
VRLRERWADAQAPQVDLNWDDVDDVVRMEEDAAFRGDAQAQVGLGAQKRRRLRGYADVRTHARCSAFAVAS